MVLLSIYYYNYLFDSVSLFVVCEFLLISEETLRSV